MQSIVSMYNTCKTQATHSSMDWIAQHQHQNLELLVNAQIHKSVNFN